MWKRWLEAKIIIGVIIYFPAIIHPGMSAYIHNLIDLSVVNLVIANFLL